MNGESFSISEALHFGWDAFKRNIAMAVGLGFASLAVMFVLNGITQASQRYAVLSLGVSLLAQVVQIGFAFLWVRFALSVYDGQPLHARELWPDGTTFLNYLAVSILYGLLVTAGLILLVVPGIYKLGTSGPPHRCAMSRPQGESALRADRRAQRTPFLVKPSMRSDYHASGVSSARERRSPKANHAGQVASWGGSREA
jgi:hypothetical protein